MKTHASVELLQLLRASEPCQLRRSQSPQSTSDCFPLRDSKVWSNEICCQVLCPGFVRRGAIWSQQICKISSLQNTHTTRPDLVVAIATRFHQKKNGHQDRIDGNDEMR